VIKVYKNPELLLSALADFIVVIAKESIAKTGQFNFALSGGSSPKKLYELLASNVYSSKIDWKNVFFFFGDERNVPHNHPDSNFLMTKKTLFDPLKIASDHVFPINTALSPEVSAMEYADKMTKHFKGNCKFDFILLGLGDNSHTASLFPHTSVLHEKTSLMKGLYIDEVKMDRITFTAPLINQAHTIGFLVYGSGKAEAVKHIIEDPTNIDEYPAQLIKPISGELIWFLDEAAASSLKTSAG
jgi:6-phosphogluconolactonase